ncbi:MAG: glutamyl-tRNA reductase [Deltaproteobacteria bacterium RIFCSPLOWO2_12_FULL_44_12]|nr:MAG: glutamyl-tRNA reductase [Deltaproteobacteria bacterium RIFCSPHIGHO2_01_FULL_43_49]OGQ15258.1 MAG: glutamyl-tRNA reductase [Deltaproteobacteria bacterium RIFCSPHIGHO2_02_FULL_44_53]OGQ27118.1 MAG: glutamyl-tRNA reductase [Deltaproteobacteria bacterium RIFCSPHIGHO2_12_FULL_44_21]OGQ31774.1 MAG: glutamyl-tRNA reductase [Deltaproteobacteria bacterium RIFCSPLOWO2_01_FULL_45_74]OGQ42976.1 MAG: glutamyl-tRNA reductase [Deltaproteobacteria bacterium RIFCSPLOWO2_02_FULL_44_34]OGQ70013.1 MAG: gl
MELIVLGYNFKGSSIGERERWILPPPQVPVFLKGLCSLAQVSGACYLATCNRVEIYVSLQEQTSTSDLMAYWKDFLNLKDENPFPNYVYRNKEALQHLIKVATGLDSLVLGETQVLGQVKQAYMQTLAVDVADSNIHFIFQKAFQIAKRIRTNTGIARYPTSVSSVSIMLIEQIFGSFDPLTVLVVGLGEMGVQAAELLKKRGVKKLIVANRTRNLAEKLAGRLAAQVVPFDKLEEILPHANVVVTSTAANAHIISKKMLLSKGCLERPEPSILIDLGVPRNIDPEVGTLDNVYLYNVDDLKTIADKNLSFRKQEGLLAEEMLQQSMTSLVEEWQRRQCRFSPIFSS